MIEYISKWRVIETLQELKEKSPTYFELPLWTAIEKIRDIPAADVRERSYGGMYEDLIKRLRELTGTDNLTEFDEAADAIEELVGKIDRMRWRSAEDDPPPVAEKVIVATKFVKRDGKRLVDTDMLLANGNWFEHSVTHWMPPPEPPKEESDD